MNQPNMRDGSEVLDLKVGERKALASSVGMTLFKVTYIRWVKNHLESSGANNVKTANVLAVNQFEAAVKLRASRSHEAIEITGISTLGTTEVA